MCKGLKFAYLLILDFNHLRPRTKSCVCLYSVKTSWCVDFLSEELLLFLIPACFYFGFTSHCLFASGFVGLWRHPGGQLRNGCGGRGCQRCWEQHQHCQVGWGRISWVQFHLIPKIYQQIHYSETFFSQTSSLCMNTWSRFSRTKCGRADHLPPKTSSSLPLWTDQYEITFSVIVSTLLSAYVEAPSPLH